MTGKVAALVTRPASAGNGTEVLVFQHPMAGVQFPAGSLFDGEDETVGCARELHEETGPTGTETTVDV